MFDIAAGNFKDDVKMEWFGLQNLSPNSAAQEWNEGDDKIKTRWKIAENFNRVAVAKFQNLATDQAVLLRTADGVLKFAGESSTSPGTGVVWGTASVGSNWLNVAAGNLDDEAAYKEAVIIKSNLMRIYLISQSPDEYLDCAPHAPDFQEECVEISGSFSGEIAVGDLGVFTKPPKTPDPYVMSPTIIMRSPILSSTIAPQTLFIRGESAISVPIAWTAAFLPEMEATRFKELSATEHDLSISITSQGVEYTSSAESGTLLPVSWIGLSAYAGTTPSTITTVFSNTFPGSPLFDTGLHQATILFYREAGVPPEERFRYADVYINVSRQKIYLPVIMR